MNISLNKAMIGTLSVGCALCFGLPAQSQQVQPQTTQPKQQDGSAAELQKLRQQSQAVQRKLQQIEQQAKEKDPKLEKTETRLHELYREKLAEHGYPSEKELQELREMQQRLQSGEDLDEAERQELLQEFQKELGVMREAEQKARADQEVQKALQELETMREKAMNAVDDSASDLQQELQKLQAEIQKLQQQQFQRQQQQQQ